MAITVAVLLLLQFVAVIGKQTYIIHMKPQVKPETFDTHRDWYSASLHSLESSPDTTILYTYDAVFHGFAASLDPDQVETLRKSDSVLGVYEDEVYHLHTTRSPEFLGLDSETGVWEGRETEDLNSAMHDVIVGVLDSGVWPESASFEDFGMPDVPARWRGECEAGPDFSPKVCNKKLIGARSFSKGFRMSSGGSIRKNSKEVESPRDSAGHGTHTSSTAAGSRVANASLLGYASGTARGMAVNARVATYKVCWSSGCFGSDILAAMDRAILDGVDVLSLSLGGGSGPYYRDTIAIGAFVAMDKGIFVACSAGNSGPTKASLANVAPWIMTVGAGTLDRDFPAFATLGANKYVGVSLYSGNGMGDKAVPLVYDRENSSSNLCLPGSLNPATVRGKVVLCDRGINSRVEKGQVVRDAGGVGMILANTAITGEELVADSHLLPAVAVGKKVGDMIRVYVRTDPNPTALLNFGGTVLDVKPSPIVAAFSSRGPNMVTPQILKPDVIGPGVNILAAWTEATGPSGMEKDVRKTKFNIMSGTSMSCPHISGLAALLKAAHPNWSPSAIKSALMTTAYTQDNTGFPLRDASGGGLSTPWAHGSGHVDPQKALSPGLVYDTSPDEYIKFLCSMYTLQHLQTIVKRPNVTCAKKFSDPGQLNYPSFSILFGKKRTARYTRTLTNVGTAGSIYQVTLDVPSPITATVKPMKLAFKNVGDKLSYTVTFVSSKAASQMAKPLFGSIMWSNDQHQVKSPVAFSWNEYGETD
ncbi:unnamed protein product [Rhodiola kirilowii]